jgi:hypothetical protein
MLYCSSAGSQGLECCSIAEGQLAFSNTGAVSILHPACVVAAAPRIVDRVHAQFLVP